MQRLFVNEIFHSLQGEGGRAGAPTIFIRLSGCNLTCDFCDTDYSNYRKMTLIEIANIIKLFNCQWIVWTGGEPTLQLNDEIVKFFAKLNYHQAIESNGTAPIPLGIDYIAISPKTFQIHSSISNIDEARFVISKVGDKPNISALGYAKVKRIYLSPKFDSDNELNYDLLNYCANLCLQNPRFNLSVQQHKMWKMQ